MLLNFSQIIVCLLHCVSGVPRQVAELVRSSAPPKSPRKSHRPYSRTNKTSLFSMSVNFPTINCGFRCNVSEIWISRFVYLENDAMFAFRANSYFWLDRGRSGTCDLFGIIIKKHLLWSTIRTVGSCLALALFL